MPETRSNAGLAHPPPPPVHFAGQWIAWNRERTEIVAHGSDMATVQREAVAAGYADAILQRVRKPNERFIGAA